MHLKEWLHQNRMTQYEFAKEIGYLHTYLSNCLHQRANPGRKFLEAVEKATKGQVTRKDWPKKGDLKTNKNQMNFDFDKPRQTPRDTSGRFLRKST